MATFNASIAQVNRVNGSANATVNFQDDVVIFPGSTLKIQNRLNTGYVVTSAAITVTSVVDARTVVVTGLSALDASDFVVPDEEIGTNCAITNTYPQT